MKIQDSTEMERYFQFFSVEAKIPGRSGRIPTKDMLQIAKKKVLSFLEREEAKEAKDSTSDLIRAFQLASGELVLRFDWSFAKQRVKYASFDRKRKVDKWDECLAMTSGDSNATSEIFICGTKFMTQRALNSVLCHEALHNLARRTRKGNPFLAEDTEHMAMALLGDPQLVHEPSLIEAGLEEWDSQARHVPWEISLLKQTGTALPISQQKGLVCLWSECPAQQQCILKCNDGNTSRFWMQLKVLMIDFPLFDSPRDAPISITPPYGLSRILRRQGDWSIPALRDVAFVEIRNILISESSSFFLLVSVSTVSICISMYQW